MNGNEYQTLKEGIDEIKAVVSIMDLKLDAHCILQAGKCATNDAKLASHSARINWIYGLLGAIITAIILGRVAF